MSLPIIMHINYCEQGQSIEEICYKAVAWGFDGVEFRNKRTGVIEETEQYFEALAKAVEKSGLKQVIFGNDDPEALTDKTVNREAVVERISKFYRLASNYFKLSVCNAFTGILRNPDKNVSYSDYHKNGSFAATGKQWEMAAENYKVLGKLAEELEFRFAFETHMCYIHDLPASAKKLVDMVESPAVGINLDYGNAVYMKAQVPSVEEAIKIAGKSLFYVHLKNSIGIGDGVRLPASLGDGEINHRKYLKLLKQYGYHGPICIEAPRDGDREWFAQQDIIYIKSLTQDIGL